LVGFFVVRKRHAGLFLSLLVVSAVYIFIIASWWCWWYVGFGNRAFINLYPVLSIPLAAFIAFVLTKKWWWKLTLICVLASGLALSVFQTLQYQRGVIHWGYMSKSAYVESFLRWNPTPLFTTHLEIPNIHKAMQGENEVYQRLIDTVSVHKVNFEQVDNFDWNHSSLIQEEVVFQGNKSMSLPGGVNYALNEKLEVKNANRIHITAWVKNPEEFSLCISYNDNQFYAQSGAVVNHKNGWDKIELYAEIPETVKNQELMFFLWKINGNHAYIDDIRIVLTHEKIVE